MNDQKHPMRRASWTKKRGLIAVLTVLGLSAASLAPHVPLVGEHNAYARIRGGGFRGGGVARGGAYRGVSRTTYRPGVGVSRTTAYGGVAGARVYRPRAAYIGRPGVTYGRAARTVARRSAYYGAAYGAAYGASYGTSYSYGSPVYALPYGCATTWWNGTTAYSCNGTTYTYDYVNGGYVYYPVYY